MSGWGGDSVKLHEDPNSRPFREVLLRTQPNGLSFFVNIWRTRPGDSKRGHTVEERSIATQITGGQLVGSVADKLENELFVSAYHKNINELGNFEQTGSDRLHIVSTKLKNVIEGLNAPKSEFIPVKASLLAKDRRKGQNSFGGGSVVDGVYWLWNCYNWLDLVINEQSTWANSVGYDDRVRGDLPGSPVQPVHHWGSAAPTWGRKLVLKPIDYTANPFFRVVGIEDGLFLSMAAADALKEAGLLAWEGDVHIAYTELDLLSTPPIGQVPLKIAGTDILLFDERAHPFPSLTPPQR